MTNLRNRNLLLFLLFSGLMLLSGCATLDISPDKTLAPATEKQPVTIGIQAYGEMMRSTVENSDGVVKTASGTLFDKVILLPTKSKLMLPAEIAAAHGVDYILILGIDDIGVAADLNPIWIASIPLLPLNLVVKPFTPIITFQPTISIEATLKDARTGVVILHKEILESRTDHFSPMQAGEKVRGLILRTISNALVTVMKDTQVGIAAARSGKAVPQ